MAGTVRGRAVVGGILGEDFGGLTVATAKQYHDWFKPHSVYTVSDASRGMLSKTFGSTPETWPGMQMAHDLWQARGRAGETAAERFLAARHPRRAELSLCHSHPISEPARKTAGSLRPAGSSPSRLCRHYTLHMAVYVDIIVRIQGIVIHYSLLPLRDGLSFLRS